MAKVSGRRGQHTGERLDVRYFNENSVSLQGNGTCVKPKVQSGASYIPTVIRRSYVYGILKRIAGYGLKAAQMQLTAGRHLIMEPKAAGWIRIKQMIWGAGHTMRAGAVYRNYGAGASH